MHGTKLERVLRFSLALSFIYPAISAWFNPYAWIGYFPAFMLDFAGPNVILMLHIFGATEIVIGLSIIFGRKILYPSIVAAIYLLLIVVLNLSQMDVIFRDISILGIAIALILLHKEEKLD